MKILCEQCNLEFDEHKFQNHLITVHNMLFSQYIGLISKHTDLISGKINFVNKKKKK